ncbi:MAG: hypothetical protein C5B49_08535 [Bdellovibrio sp.]|nr:MAG: hypothetical protein C5B49_08535 [Bdellovibrio sp.]
MKSLAVNLACAWALIVTTAAQGQVASTSGTRGLERFEFDTYSTAIINGNFSKVSKWVAKVTSHFDAEQTPFTEAFAVAMEKLATVASDLKNEKSSAKARAAWADALFEQQQALREKIRPFRGGSLGTERIGLVLVQTMLEEALLPEGGEKTFEYAKLTEDELAGAAKGKIRGVHVMSGDIFTQIGAEPLSSHFIAYSQSYPGLTSHVYVVSEGGPNPEIMEALIEDGVNRRPPTKGQLARLWVLSLDNPEARARVARSVVDFKDQKGIPFVAEGHGTESRLLYDSTMNPQRMDQGQGCYFCSALVMRIYQLAGLLSEEIPYRENKSNWNPLIPGSVEKGLYNEVDVTADRVPAPGDVLLNSAFKVRAMILDVDGLRKSRRLRAVIDAFFDLLKANSNGVRDKLLTAFHQIPKMDVNKAEILDALAKIKLDDADGQKRIEEIRNAAKESLPQSANLRQIAFFLTLNSIIQEPALEELKKFEDGLPDKDAKTGEPRLKIASPGELREAARKFLVDKLDVVRGALDAVSGNKLGPATEKSTVAEDAALPHNGSCPGIL